MGVATTNLASRSAARRINAFRAFLNDPERGALPTLFAGTQEYPKVSTPSRAARRTETALRLWEATAKLTGVTA
ncbi:hypothetical protein ADK54_05640 [Streptomyces sp. WM6378]|nr:hypothetical protein ADK54_05640 [Streptomyces sp. WM6378]